MQFLPVDAALRLSHDHLDELRRDAAGIRLRRRRRRPVSPPVTAPSSRGPGGGIAA